MSILDRLLSVKSCQGGVGWLPLPSARTLHLRLHAHVLVHLLILSFALPVPEILITTLLVQAESHDGLVDADAVFLRSLTLHHFLPLVTMLPRKLHSNLQFRNFHYLTQRNHLHQQLSRSLHSLL